MPIPCRGVIEERFRDRSCARHQRHCRRHWLPLRQPTPSDGRIALCGDISASPTGGANFLNVSGCEEVNFWIPKQLAVQGIAGRRAFPLQEQVPGQSAHRRGLLRTRHQPAMQNHGNTWDPAMASPTCSLCAKSMTTATNRSTTPIRPSAASSSTMSRSSEVIRALRGQHRSRRT